MNDRVTTVTTLSQEELVARTLRPARDVIPVLGAGISEGAGLPGASSLANHLLDVGEFAHGERPTCGPLFDVVDRLTPEWQRSRLRDVAAEFLAVDPSPEDPMAQALINVPSRFVVTFNYDLLLERTARAAGKPDPRVLSNTGPDLQAAHRLLVHGPWPPEQLTVLHLHGAVTAPETIVLGGDSYREFVRSADVASVLAELMLHRKMLFYGTTLNEAYLLTVLQAQINRAEHVLVCHEDEERELTQGRLAISFARHSIRITTVPSFDELAAHVARLSIIWDKPSTGGTQTTGTLPDGAPYIANEFADRRRPVSEEDRIVAFLHHDGEDTTAAITEDDVVAGHRTLVLGSVGSGKSDLLAQLARTCRAERPAVLIRLGDQTFTGGNPERVLGRWAWTALSANGDVNVSPDVIAGGSLHFLLDGLDEVPSTEQPAAAQLIVDLASRLPQHAFTVTSRDVAAVSTLTDAAVEGQPSWQVLQLVPGARWQREYLQYRGVRYEELLDAMPELRELPDVLTTPFFLSRVVDLHEVGGLAGLKDLGALLAALISSQLEREELQLSMDPAQIRHWLQNVALAGLLAGRQSFSSDELQGFRLPEGAAGGPERLAAMLVQRLMLAENAGVYRFSHRILGEQLAAEAIVRRRPSIQLVDCLVPRRSATISGVREDALVTLTLACMRSEDWRIAVAARDPLAAAAATPGDAEPAERRAAAQLLWDVYTRRAVWMWQRGASSLLDHASALGRLIAADPETGIARQVRAAIHEGAREQQGNAIRAWASSRPDGFVEDLRTVLSDHARDGVVHRQAAVAAKDAGFVELVDELAQLVEEAMDYAVRETAAYALVRLLPPDRRLEIGLRLMRSPEADLVLSRLADGLSPRELVLMAAAYDGDEASWDRRLKAAITAAISELSGASGPGVIAAACQATILWELDPQPAARLGQADVAAAVRGIAEASRSGAEWWRAMRLASAFPTDELRGAGVDQKLVQHAQGFRDAERVRAEPGPVVVEAIPAEDPAEPPPLTLAELVSGSSERTDLNLLGMHRVLAGQVCDLEECLRERLEQRIERWWPDRPFATTIKWVGPGKWQHERKSSAWLSYATALGLALDAERWAQVATCGVLFEPEHRWLRGQATELGQTRAAELLGDTRDPRRWAEVLACCEDPVAEPLLRAAADALGSKPADPLADELAGRRHVLRRLVAGGHVSWAQRVADQYPELTGTFDAMLAEHGYVARQIRLLERMADRARAGESLVHGDLRWMEGIKDERLLEPLFTVLGLVWKTSDKPTTRISAGTGLHDVTNPVMGAIRRIGGEHAVNGYDVLLDRGGDGRWLHAQRDEIAASLLRLDGQRAAAAAAREASLPALSPITDETRP